jgi:hypothetical protein
VRKLSGFLFLYGIECHETAQRLYLFGLAVYGQIARDAVDGSFLIPQGCKGGIHAFGYDLGQQLFVVVVAEEEGLLVFLFHMLCFLLFIHAAKV